MKRHLSTNAVLICPLLVISFVSVLPSGVSAQSDLAQTARPTTGIVSMMPPMRYATLTGAQQAQPPATARGAAQQSTAPTARPFVGPQVTFGVNAGAGTDHIVLFSDGSVLWRLPDEGFDEFDTERSRREMPDFWGTYTINADQVLIRWLRMGEETARLYPDGRLVFRGTTYLFRSSCDGLQLEGIYARNDLGPQSPEIAFRRDGGFHDTGILGVLGMMDEATGRFRVSPAPGSGTYTCSGNTLILRYADGRVARLSFYVAGERVQPPRVIVAHTYSLERRQ
jgi:hypothetical protein